MFCNSVNRLTGEVDIIRPIIYEVELCSSVNLSIGEVDLFNNNMWSRIMQFCEYIKQVGGIISVAEFYDSANRLIGEVDIIRQRG